MFSYIRWNRLSVFIAAAVLVLLFASAAQAQDETIYYRWQDDGLATYTCTQEGTRIRVVISNRSIEWNNLPPGAQSFAQYIYNGVVLTSPRVPIGLVGSGSSPLANFTDSPTSGYPLTYSYAIFTVVDGQPVYESTYSLSCSADGRGTVTVTNRKIDNTCLADIPAGSVQGRIVETTPAFFEPRESAGANFSIPAGTSWWIIGASDGFYKLFIACRANPVWVRASAVGPNFEAGGAALPDVGA